MANTVSILVKARDEASGVLDSVSGRADRMGRKFRLAAGIASGVLAAGLGTAVKAASDLEESMNKANEVFGDSIGDIQNFAKTSADSFGISQRAAFEYTGTLGTILSASGLASDATADMSIGLTKLAADMASFNNLSIDTALEKIRSGLVGEAEPLRTVGVLLSAAAVQAKALELGLGDASGALTEAEKVQARYALILEQTTTQQGDFTRTADSLANAQRRMSAQIEDLQANLGQVLLPAITAVVVAANSFLGLLNDMSPQMQTAVVAAAALTAGLLALAAVLPTLIAGFGALGVVMSGPLAPVVLLAVAAGIFGIKKAMDGAAEAARKAAIESEAFARIQGFLAEATGQTHLASLEWTQSLESQRDTLRDEIAELERYIEANDKSRQEDRDLAGAVAEAEEALARKRDTLIGVNAQIKALEPNVRSLRSGVDDLTEVAVFGYKAFVQAGDGAGGLSDELIELNQRVKDNMTTLGQLNSRLLATKLASDLVAAGITDVGDALFSPLTANIWREIAAMQEQEAQIEAIVDALLGQTAAQEDEIDTEERKIGTLNREAEAFRQTTLRTNELGDALQALSAMRFRDAQERMKGLRGDIDASLAESGSGLLNPLRLLSGSNVGMGDVDQLLSFLSVAASAGASGNFNQGAAVPTIDTDAWAAFQFLMGQGLVTNTLDPNGHFVTTQGVTLADLIAALENITINVGGQSFVTDVWVSGHEGAMSTGRA